MRGKPKVRDSMPAPRPYFPPARPDLKSGEIYPKGERPAEPDKTRTRPKRKRD